MHCNTNGSERGGYRDAVIPICDGAWPRLELLNCIVSKAAPQNEPQDLNGKSDKWQKSCRLMTNII